MYFVRDLRKKCSYEFVSIWMRTKRYFDRILIVNEHNNNKKEIDVTWDAFHEICPLWRV